MNFDLATPFGLTLALGPDVIVMAGAMVLMLVAAFAGRERILAAYREAVDRGYRFYSYGDATLIL